MNEIKVIKLAIKLFYIVLFIGLGLLYPIKGLFAYMESDLSYLGIANYTSYTSFWVWSIFVIKYIYTIISLIGVSYLIKTLNVNEIKDIFSTNNIKLFLKSGKFFHYAASVGSLRIFIRYIDGDFANLKSSNDFITLFYFFLIFGFFLIAFSKVLEFANNIQQENDLTI
jgi:hypothetical protein